MKPLDFHHWLSEAQSLSPSQIEQAYSWFECQKQKALVFAELEKKQDCCPYCGDSHVIRWGNANKLARYRCKHCHKTFNALTGTPLARLRHRGQWIQYAAGLVEGISVRKAAQQCTIDKNTSFRWRHRFLKTIAGTQPNHLAGIVEADETYFLESHKGERNLSRKPRKRGGKASKRGLSDEQIPVLIARDRTGVTIDSVLPKANFESLEKILDPILESDCVLCTDGNPIYHAFTEKHQLEHHVLNLSKGVRVEKPAFHIQNVNAYDSRLKEWMDRFHGVATKYLPNYLGWKRCLDKCRENLSPQTILLQALGYDQHLMQT